MPSFKFSRTAEDVKRELTAILRTVKDPRVNGLISIVKVELAQDYSTCKVYVSSMEGFDAAKQAVKGLTNAAGYVRRELAGRMRMRYTPQIVFIADDSIEYSARINEVLMEIKRKEEHED